MKNVTQIFLKLACFTWLTAPHTQFATTTKHFQRHNKYVRYNNQSPLFRNFDGCGSTLDSIWLKALGQPVERGA